MEKKSEICQSCGMPMDKAELLGTEKDGSKNHEFCAHCYLDGAFVDSSISLADMKSLVKNYLEKEKLPAGEIDIAVQGIDHLKRWKKNNVSYKTIDRKR